MTPHAPTQVEVSGSRTLYYQAHRKVGAVLAWLAFHHGLDGWILTPNDLRRLLAVKRVTHTRIEWFQEDLKEDFPYQETLWLDPDRNVGCSLYLCRSSLTLPVGCMTDQRRLNLLPPGHPRLALFERQEPGTIEPLVRELAARVAGL